MEEKELKAKDIPMGYELCFNSGCADNDTCMHYQAMLLTSADRYKGQAVFPVAWQDGKCRCYREKKLVKKAWGFNGLYKNVDSSDRTAARRSVSSYFGRGNGQYYRAHHGEITLSPKQQADILQIVAQFGSLDGIKFDGYKIEWDFD